MLENHFMAPTKIQITQWGTFTELITWRTECDTQNLARMVRFFCHFRQQQLNTYDWNKNLRVLSTSRLSRSSQPLCRLSKYRAELELKVCCIEGPYCIDYCPPRTDSHHWNKIAGLHTNRSKIPQHFRGSIWRGAFSNGQGKIVGYLSTFHKM